MPTFIEVIDPFDALTDAEREALAAWWFAAAGQTLPPPGLSEDALARDNRYRYAGLSARARLRGYRAYEKYLRARGLSVPTLPPLRAWCVWHLRQRGWKYERIIAQGSPATISPAPAEGVSAPLTGRTAATRHQQALRCMEDVSAFRAACERAGYSWYYEWMARVMLDLYDRRSA